MSNHQLYMQRAFELAKLGGGFVAPNPMVGCVIVHQNVIIGEGFHQKYGEAHAEVHAIKSVNDKAKLAEATVYVSLEPCSHFGKTPPCADLLIENKVKKVVVCNLDPNPLVAGQGIAKLNAAGIEVNTGILEKEGLELNKRFFTFIEKKRPYITLKWAQSADGFIAGQNGEQIQISNHFSTKLVHKMRAENAAIMVGTNTAKTDNPKLNVRAWEGKNPIRVLIDKQLTLKNSLNIFDQSQNTICYNLVDNKVLGINNFVKLNHADNLIPQILNDLYQRNIQSVLVEGGAKLLDSFLELGLWDEALVIKSEKVIYKGTDAPKMDFSTCKTIDLEGDILFFKKNRI